VPPALIAELWAEAHRLDRIALVKSPSIVSAP
jgi:hypothetical protein